MPSIAVGSIFDERVAAGHERVTSLCELTNA